MTLPAKGASVRSIKMFPTLLFPGLFILNGFLISPYIGWYDSGEMVGATACLGISHPSGQVLFHLLGKCFLLIPFSTPAWRLGLMSTLCASLASFFFWRLACRLSSKPETHGWMAVLSLIWGLSLPWWRYSLVPLVYALYLSLGLFLLWVLGLEGDARMSLRREGLFLFVLGAGVVFRPTLFFAAPFAGILLFWKGRNSNEEILKRLAAGVSLFLLGWSTALYLPLRSALKPSIAFADLTHWLPFARQVLALKFSNYVGTVSAGNVLTVLSQMAGHYWTDLTPLGLVLVLGGFYAALKFRREMPFFLWAALGWASLETLLVFTIPFPTFESHQVIFSWAVAGLFAAFGLGRLEPFVSQRPFGQTLVLVLLIGWAGVQALSLGHLWERKMDRSADDYARNLLTLMGKDALYYPSEENEYFPLAGYQQSFGFHPGIDLIEPGTSPNKIAPLIQAAFGEGRRFFVTRKYPLPPGWSFETWGPLYRVVQGSIPDIQTLPMEPGPPLAAWHKVELEKMKVIPRQAEAGGVLTLHYLWGRKGSGSEDGAGQVMVIFLDGQGNYQVKDGVFWLHDIHEPPLYSFARLKPGKVYDEERVLMIPSDFPPGTYRIMAALQKAPAEINRGHESFKQEFYERASAQNLDKFMGRGENQALVQFSPGSGKGGDDFWPVTEGNVLSGDSRFAEVGTVVIQSPGNK
jgi:hypothetical protein